MLAAGGAAPRGRLEPIRGQSGNAAGRFAAGLPFLYGDGRMPYGEILKTAFSITRRNRYLWFFGVFAGGAGFSPGGFSPGGGNDDPVGKTVESIEPGVIVAIVAVIVLLALAAIVLSLISQGALIESVAAIDRGGERRFGTAWKAGTRTFWRVLRVVVLVVLIGIGLLLAVGLPLAGLVVGVFAATEALGARIAVAVVAGLIALAALALIFIPFAIVTNFAIRELVLREERAVASLRIGYRLFRSNLGPSVLVWLIVLGVGIGATIALLLLLLAVGIVLFLPTIALAIAEIAGAAIVTGVIAGVIVLALLLVAFGALGAFNHAVWTLAYLRLERPATGAGG
jgi:hypothetical protein